MLYDDFADKVIKQDNRNSFEKYTSELTACDESAANFYKQFNPIDVEVEYDDMTIRFIPALKLSDMLKLYEYLNADMVFAECYSDPIFIKNKAVYMCSHGTANPKLEKLANSFDEYITKITQGI